MNKINYILFSLLLTTNCFSAGIVSGTISANGGVGSGGNTNNAQSAVYAGYATNSGSATYAGIATNAITASTAASFTQGLPIVFIHTNHTVVIGSTTNFYPNTTTACFSEVQRDYFPYGTNSVYSGFHAVLDSGEYDFTTPINITNNCYISGNGWWGTILEYKGATNISTYLTVMGNPFGSGLVNLVTNNYNPYPAVAPAWSSLELDNLGIKVSTNFACVLLTLNGNNFEAAWVGFYGQDFGTRLMNFSVAATVNLSLISNQPSILGCYANMATESSFRDCFFFELADGLQQVGNSYFYSYKNNYSDIGRWMSNSASINTVYPNTNTLSLGFGVELTGYSYLNVMFGDQTYYCGLGYFFYNSSGINTLKDYTDQGSTYDVGATPDSGGINMDSYNGITRHPFFYVTNGVSGNFAVDGNSVADDNNYISGDNTYILSEMMGVSLGVLGVYGDYGLSWWNGNTIVGGWDYDAGSPVWLFNTQYKMIGNGNGLTNLPASSINSGTFANARLPGITTNYTLTASTLTLYVTNGIIMGIH